MQRTMERMLKSKSVILVYAFLLLCVFGCNSETADVSEPRDLNVLLIVADDLNCDIGAYGREGAITPNLDALAERSVVFSNAHVQYPL